MPVQNVTRLPLWQRVLLFVLIGTGVAGFLPATGSDHGSSTLALLSVHAAPSVNEAIGDGSEPARSDIAATIPLAARDTLKALEQRHGQPLPGYVGGRSFLNRERALPRGRYREYDVHPKVPGKTRGAERIVIDQGTGKAFYTADHYRSFVPMN
jgi:ribonuclease T1